MTEAQRNHIDVSIDDQIKQLEELFKMCPSIEDVEAGKVPGYNVNTFKARPIKIVADLERDDDYDRSNE